MARITTLVILVALSGCQPVSSVKNAPEKVQPAAQSTELFLMPFLDGSGVALACERVEMGGLEHNLLFHAEGVPFSTAGSESDGDSISLAPHLPDVVIWSDGTMIWSQQSAAGEKTHWKGKVTARQSDALRQTIAELQSGATRFSFERTAASSNVVTSLALVDADRKLVLYSELAQMEQLKTYWYFDGDRTVEFPMKDHSLEEFYTKLPAPAAAELKTWADLRLHLRSLIPEDGEQIDFKETVKWVVQRGRGFGPVR